ncbi:MAG TPA: urea ABC transporter permease subunit UrtC, partial [Leclercia adecarboxylata]|nr:urea ABC transporter permease subunit UrtC [Leclercia adecarboxylata]
MSQPLTLTLARKAPRSVPILLGLILAALLVLPFLALLP